MRDAYIKTLHELAVQDKNIYCLVADIGMFVLDDFRRDFPKKFLNLGVAESNMIGVAAGLALSGKLPFVYTIASFLTMRSFEQIRVDICCQNLNVKIVGVGGGLAYGTLGVTHHTIEDIAIMRALPNMIILSPADPLEASKVTYAAAKHEGPVYIRLGKNGEPLIYKKDYKYEIGKAITLKEGKDVTLIATGILVKNVLTAAEDLSKKGIDVRVINMHTIKPLDQEIILKAADETRAIITIEEHSIIGGLGSAVAEVLAEDSKKVLFKRIGINDTFCSRCGKQEDLQERYGMSVTCIVGSVKKLFSKNL